MSHYTNFTTEKQAKSRVMRAPQARKIAPASDIEKAKPSSEKWGQAELLPTLSVKAVILFPIKFPTGRIKPLQLTTIAAFAKISEKLKKSITVDNGKEFAAGRV